MIAGPNGAQGRGPRPRRSFSARAQQAASLHARGYSRKETAGILGVAPETVSVWKRHPKWQLEVDRWRALADGGLDRQQLALNSAALRATSEALEQLQLIMTTATKRVRTSSGLTEQPDRTGRPDSGLAGSSSRSASRRFPSFTVRRSPIAASPGSAPSPLPAAPVNWCPTRYRL